MSPQQKRRLAIILAEKKKLGGALNKPSSIGVTMPNMDAMPSLGGFSMPSQPQFETPKPFGKLKNKLGTF